MAENNANSQSSSVSKAKQKNDIAKAVEVPSTSSGEPTSGAPVTQKTVSSKKRFKSSDFRKKNRSKQKDSSIQKRKKLATWSLSKLNCNFGRIPNPDIAEPAATCSACVCTGYRRTEDHHLGAGIVFKPVSVPTSCASSSGIFRTESRRYVVNLSDPVIDLSKFNPDDFPIEDCDERARRERAREMEEGVDPPPGYHPTTQQPQSQSEDVARISLDIIGINLDAGNNQPTENNECPFIEFPTSTASAIFHPMSCLTNCSSLMNRMSQIMDDRGCHTQVDYIHCLVPDILNITKCSFYWGKMDQYEAERLLENKPEGTFLLRDSAQEDYLFSVSFRRYGRSLHARIEQWNHKFSFDAHDPGVFASSSVCGLIEHYKDPSRCMFFEPMLTIPLHRSFTFSLQHLCRSTISNNITYDSINKLPLPKSLKLYLKEYHYKQRVRVRNYDSVC